MFEQIRSNKRKSAFLVVMMAALLFALGWLLAEMHEPGAGIFGLIVAAVIWFIMTLVAHFSGDQIFLTMSGAKRIEKADLPVLWNVVEEMTIASGLGKMPKIYVIDDDAPNAFATGRSAKTASVAVTSGLLRLCNRDELQGVMAHEIGHVQNRDILLMLYAGVLVGSIALLAEVGLRSFWFGGGRRSRRSSEGGGQAQAIIMLVAIALMVLAPIIARLIYFAVSRRREYLADASAAVYTRYPEGLASALEKLAAAPAKLAKANRVTAPMYIVNPMKRKGAMAADATATHPPISERVKILRSMAGVSFAEYEKTYRQVHGGRGVLPPSARMVQKEAEGRQARPSESAKKRAREVDDFFYRRNDYRALTCSCGAALKIPPGFLFSRVKCPHCGHQHETSLFEKIVVAGAAAES
jgi:heat shock protein HtpX